MVLGIILLFRKLENNKEFNLRSGRILESLLFTLTGSYAKIGFRRNEFTKRNENRA